MIFSQLVSIIISILFYYCVFCVQSFHICLPARWFIPAVIQFVPRLAASGDFWKWAEQFTHSNDRDHEEWLASRRLQIRAEALIHDRRRRIREQQENAVHSFGCDCIRCLENGTRSAIGVSSANDEFRGALAFLERSCGGVSYRTLLAYSELQKILSRIQRNHKNGGATSSLILHPKRTIGDVFPGMELVLSVLGFEENVDIGEPQRPVLRLRPTDSATAVRAWRLVGAAQEHAAMHDIIDEVKRRHLQKFWYSIVLLMGPSGVGLPGCIPQMIAEHTILMPVWDLEASCQGSHFFKLEP